MDDTFTSALLAALGKQHAQGGGFRSRGGNDYRPDATAWAIVALQAFSPATGNIQSGQARLAADQQPDGRISISPEHLEAFWPTPLAILAWQQAPKFREAQTQAVQFLLHTSGLHFPKNQNLPVGHDPSIQGWPWIAGAHSWVIPTAMAVLALRVAGYGEHGRIGEARRLLLDRQLPDGGWNYGNITVFGQKLHPMPESTGMALCALAGIVGREEIAVSLDYLKLRVAQVRTPVSLSWGLLGLGAWGEKPAAAALWLRECWRRQERYGGYDTEAISLMLLALTTPRGIPALFEPGRSRNVQ